MRQISYALFPTDAASHVALAETLALGIPREACSAIVHGSSFDNEQLVAIRSASLVGLPIGAVVGGIVGTIGGAVMFGPLGLVVAGALAVGGAAAILCGAVGGLAGVSAPLPALEQMVKHLERGEVLMVVESHDFTTHEAIDGVLKRCGGHASTT